MNSMKKRNDSWVVLFWNGWNTLSPLQKDISLIAFEIRSARNFEAVFRMIPFVSTLSLDHESNGPCL